MIYIYIYIHIYIYIYIYIYSEREREGYVEKRKTLEQREKKDSRRKISEILYKKDKKCV